MLNHSFRTAVVVLACLSVAACGNPVDTTGTAQDVAVVGQSADMTSGPMTISFVITSRTNAPEAVTFEGGSWTVERELAQTAVLICHPEKLLMIDTGLGRDIDTQFTDMPFYLKPLFAYDFVGAVADMVDMEAFCPGRSLDIIATHLHWDHASGIEDFAGTPVHVTSAERKAARAIGTGAGYIDNQTDAEDINWQDIVFADEPYASYAQSLDMFGDGRVVLVPMAGHTAGSVGIFVTLDEARRYFFTGDITWVVEGFTSPAHKHALMRAIADGEEIDLLETEIARVHALSIADPGLKLVPAHDAKAYIADAIYPASVTSASLQ